MSKKPNPAIIKKRMSKDLLSLYQTLRNNATEVILNPEVLIASANELEGSDRKEWKYDVAELRFQVPVQQHTLPLHKQKFMLITVNIDLCGFCDDETEDCLTASAFNIRIETQDKKNICSWHFDRHIALEDDSEPEEVHPLYHFQHGGNAMKEISDSLGRVLILPAPRLAFPPLDAILAIDFVLSNFAGKSWKNLRNDPTYSRLLKEAQRRHWKPYIDRLAAWWEPGPRREERKTMTLWPHLI